jgi:hypothetical protein
MRIVVTGGTGFVGRPLVCRLGDLGHEVVVVSRAPQRAKEQLGVNEAWTWDDLHECFQVPVDAVIHLAGETVQGRWTEKKEAEVWESRIRTTSLLAQAIETAKVKPSVWISASGIGFYGEGGERHLAETDGPGDDYFARLCVEWEGLALATETPEMRVVCSRFGIILGEGGGALKAMLLPAKSGLSGPLGTGRQWWSWVSLDDVVGVLVHALGHKEIRGPLNVVAPEPIRQADFQRVLCRVLRRPAWLPAPAFGVRLILGRFADEVLSSKRVMPNVLVQTGYQWQFSSLDALLVKLFGSAKQSVILPLLGAFALMGAPYGKTPHLVDIARNQALEPMAMEVVVHAGMHLALLPWLLVVLFSRALKG